MFFKSISKLKSRLPLFCAAMAMTTTMAAAAALGTQTASNTSALTTGGTTMTTATFSGTYNQTEHYLTYAPGSDVLPKLAYGTTLYGRSDLTYVAGWVRDQNLQAVAGINASFFDLSSGLPTGPEVTGGLVRATNDAFRGYCIGFKADGSAQIGLSNIKTAVTWPSGAPSNCLINRVLTKNNGLVLYNRDYDSKTKNTIDAYNLILEVDTDQVVLNGLITATVVGRNEASSCDIPAGGMVLSVAKDTLYQSLVQRFDEVAVGDTITFYTTCAAGWEDCVDICSAGDLLVWKGAVQDDFTLDSKDHRAARTALGIRADGTVVLYTVDGASSTSAGVTLATLAQRMLELGCVSAVNLDGGGSTTLGTVSSTGEVTIRNSPSDGAQRKCANYIFLCYDIQRIQASPVDAVLLPGARTSIRVTGTSGSGHTTPAPPQLTLQPSAGTASGTIFTAPDTAGTVSITVRAGELTAETSVTVAQPDEIAVTDANSGDAVTSLTLDTGASVDLNAAGLLDGKALPGQDDSFRWTVTDGLGSITPAGVFTAAVTQEDLTGSITVTCGETSVEIPVLVEGGVEIAHTVWDFEQTLPQSGAGLSVSASSTQVRYGSRSAALQYDFSAAQNTSGARQVLCSSSVALGDEARRLGFWLWADGSGNSVSVRIEQDGKTSSIWAATMTQTGWRYVTVALPAGEKTLAGFAVTENGTAQTGTLYLDNVLISRFAFEDETPPVLTATVDGGTLTVTAQDAKCEVVSLAVTIDGVSLPLSAGGTAQLPADGMLHQVQIRAADAVGNLSGQTLTLDGTVDAPFADMSGHWAAQPVNYMAREGVLDGSTGKDGVRRFRPNDAMTRQEFIKAVVAWRGVDTADYASVALPFADTQEAGAWALPYLRAAYSLGLVTGSRGTDGKLYLNPTDTITRQEAMAILGRTQPKGYTAADLGRFSDAGRVASWAQADIAAMVGRGVISGSQGKLDPDGNVTRAQVAKMLFGLY